MTCFQKTKMKRTITSYTDLNSLWAKINTNFHHVLFKMQLNFWCNSSFMCVLAEIIAAKLFFFQCNTHKNLSKCHNENCTFQWEINDISTFNTYENIFRQIYPCDENRPHDLHPPTTCLMMLVLLWNSIQRHCLYLTLPSSSYLSKDIKTVSFLNLSMRVTAVLYL